MALRRADEPESATAEAEDRLYVAGMERLVDAVRDLASAHALDDIVDVVRRAARELTGADGATFILREGEHCFYVDEDAIAPLWAGSRFPLDACISGWAMLNAQTVVIEDIYVDDRIPHDAYRPTFVKSLVMVPVRAAEPIAAIGNYWAEPHLATPTEVRLLQALADSTAVAIQNVAVLSQLEARVEERTEEVRRAYQDLQQLALGVAHDLQSPLTTITGYAAILRRRFADALGDDGLGILDALEHGAGGMSELVADLVSFAGAGSSTLDVRPVDLGELVDDVVERLGGAVTSVGARVERADLPTLPVDANLFGRLLQNLVGNAVAYGGRGGAPVVTVAAAQGTDGGWVVTVGDNGPGVPEAERESVFEPFARGSTAKGRRGTGLGLAICRRVAERHGGTIAIADADGGGAEFRVLLPAGPGPAA